jgi:hypothetical protein
LAGGTLRASELTTTTTWFVERTDKRWLNDPIEVGTPLTEPDLGVEGPFRRRWPTRAVAQLSSEHTEILHAAAALTTSAGPGDHTIYEVQLDSDPIAIPQQACSLDVLQRVAREIAAGAQRWVDNAPEDRDERWHEAARGFAAYAHHFGADLEPSGMAGAFAKAFRGQFPGPVEYMVGLRQSLDMVEASWMKRRRIRAAAGVAWKELVEQGLAFVLMRDLGSDSGYFFDLRPSKERKRLRLADFS